ncbi:hypothetical protein BD289DRAFT_368610 [Coniella lustricola]|uniref:P-loop containing nucleoside triphosphate hydrolase protein n=1 Tax=Coniella lustricola TaxID=2025994 RepID=A0A2T3A7R3_9PEZI|nr:hypothetical protein BD289DRAFT_368610 [Coniella lustricola]
MFESDTLEDPRSRTRTVPFEVICPGMPRTGTSCESALEILGCGPVAHMSTAVSRTRDLAMWADAAEAKFTPEKRPDLQPFGRAEWDNLLGEFRATTDSPGCFFSVELMDAYPDAKVVLVERDLDKWFTSFSTTIMAVQWPSFGLRCVLSLLHYKYGRLMDPYLRLSRACWLAESKDEQAATAKHIYKAHYAEVRAKARPGQLLEYKLGDGWEPLCEFLGKPIPDVPFPNVNDSAMFHDIGNTAIKKGLWSLFSNLAVFGGSIAAVTAVALNYGAKEWITSHLSRVQL